VYLGVSNYGQVDRDDAASFTYRFSVGGEEKTFSLSNDETDAEGAPACKLQNLLKEGYSYRLTLQDGTVTAAEELPWESEAYTPPVSGTPGEKTVKNFLATALMPVGTTLYVYGGGWNWQDNGPSLSARTLGLSPDWLRFYREQDQNYTYRDKDGDESNKDAAHSYYPYGRFNEYGYAGLDCSGYVGWVLYNTFNTESGNGGYVMLAQNMAKTYAGWGWGVYESPQAFTDHKAGDIMSLPSGHVFIVIGRCPDESVVIVHASPNGCMINGTVNKKGKKKSQAWKLARKYMRKYYPEWYAKYPDVSRGASYLKSYSRMSWYVDGRKNSVMSDPEGLRNMNAAQVLKVIFHE
jgi:hypothetical protein